MVTMTFYVYEMTFNMMKMYKLHRIFYGQLTREKYHVRKSTFFARARPIFLLLLLRLLSIEVILTCTINIYTDKIQKK